MSSDKKLLTEFLARERDGRAFLDRFEQGLRSITRSLAPDLVREGLDGEVIQQAYLLLLRRGAGHFDATRTESVWPYLREMVRLAVRDVRASYSYPGTSSRARSLAEDRPEPPLSYDGLLEEALDDRAAHDPTEAAALSAVMLASLQATLIAAPPWVTKAAAAIASGQSVPQAAESVGVSRFAVRRGLQRWVKPVLST